MPKIGMKAICKKAGERGVVVTVLPGKLSGLVRVRWSDGSETWHVEPNSGKLRGRRVRFGK
jgi:hypothetical protein